MLLMIQTERSQFTKTLKPLFLETDRYKKKITRYMVRAQYDNFGIKIVPKHVNKLDWPAHELIKLVIFGVSQ